MHTSHTLYISFPHDRLFNGFCVTLHVAPIRSGLPNEFTLSMREIRSQKEEDLSQNLLLLGIR